ncbi:Rieske 2Fe-2S domain-containing protein [Halorubellus sp. JP-L1]|uniref:Rieske (2Fe-2S) protein n=1 Tax=Halorubellus sp. JP-L1 TaxID=2715753 RepID=UPI001408E51B|nr:Rieske 2Fe-2S domain-containing protein [Halorubellus sp. JP-L1]NHN42022.1 Rieske 2Fe-2S domain-containing protein [Halorubellus sp. JP-L1]
MATSDDAGDDGFVRATSLATLREAGRELLTARGRAIAVFHHEGQVRAVDNRCPHMGFPLSEGSVEDGVLTCHWHHARFELSCGDTFDPWADDVRTYPTEVRDGDVYVHPDPPRDRDPATHWRERLDTGLEENLRLVVAKSVVGLANADVPAVDVAERGVAFGTRYRADGWSSGLTILAAMTNALDVLDEADRKRALYTGLRHVASDCAGEAPRFDQPAFDVDDVSAERLAEWFRETVEVRDSDGAERVLRTAVATCDQEDVERMLYAAATDHAYLDSGHSFDMTNKAVETLDRLDWPGASDGTLERDDEAPEGRADAADVLASLVTRFTDAERAEEGSEWRQPEDLAAMRESFVDDLPALAAGERDPGWTPPNEFQEDLLGDDPHAVADALREAIRAGATVEALAHEVASAAATRVARFGTTNEFGDWNTVHHTFTYANAVQQAAGRVEPTELYRGVLDGAFSVYLDRFLNSPPAEIPDPASGDVAVETVDAHRDALRDAFDREGSVNDAGRHAAALLVVADSPRPLWSTLGAALLREDAGFHTLQAYEAALAQFRAVRERAPDAPDGLPSERERVAAVAAARYLAAHSPTRREAEQTFTIASRLLRGESVHGD